MANLLRKTRCEPLLLPCYTLFEPVQVSLRVMVPILRWIGTRMVGFSRRKVFLRRWKVSICGRRKVCLGKGKEVDIGTRTVVEGVPVGDGTDRKRNVGLCKRRREGRRKEGLGRMGPLVRGWREHEGGCKAGKNKCRGDFQLHIVSLL